VSPWSTPPPPPLCIALPRRAARPCFLLLLFPFLHTCPSGADGWTTSRSARSTSSSHTVPGVCGRTPFPPLVNGTFEEEGAGFPPAPPYFLLETCTLFFVAGPVLGMAVARSPATFPGSRRRSYSRRRFRARPPPRGYLAISGRGGTLGWELIASNDIHILPPCDSFTMKIPPLFLLLSCLFDSDWFFFPLE